MYTRAINGSWGLLTGGAGTLPTVPTIEVVSDDNEDSATVTLADGSSDTNTIYVKDATSTDDFAIATKVGGGSATRVGNGTIQIDLDVGHYFVYSSISNASGTLNSNLDDVWILATSSKDANKFFQKVVSTLKEDGTMRTLVAQNSLGNYMVAPSRFVPVGNVYPQITVDLDFKVSEPKYPAGRYNLIIRFWQSDKLHENNVFSNNYKFRDRLEAIFNREGSSFNIIDIASSNNLRVANIERRFGEYEYDRQHNKYYVDYRFDVILSESESHALADAGDKAWV